MIYIYIHKLCPHIGINCVLHINHINYLILSNVYYCLLVHAWQLESRKTCSHRFVIHFLNDCILLTLVRRLSMLRETACQIPVSFFGIITEPKTISSHRVRGLISSKERRESVVPGFSAQTKKVSVHYFYYHSKQCTRIDFTTIDC